ncbi:MAG: serine/threonine-protein kinase [Polyangiaceae bacterium]
MSDAPDLSGTKYRLVGPLGRGGMGAVWAAEDVELSREVAIKVASGAGDVRTAREARILARLEHPGIVPVHDVGTLPDGRVFYVMKRVRGERLDEWRRRERSLSRALRLFVRICEAVAFAHARGVLHRDLKPENIMVGELGEALVMDWGIAKAGVGETGGVGSKPVGDGETADGAVVGTPATMAPEQARGDLAAIDERTDVFGLGAVLYFLLVDRAPFEGQRRPGDAPPRVRSRAPEVPRPIASVCERALAMEPGRRYPSARALAADVDAFLEGESPAAHVETIPERVARLARRHSVVLTLLVAYLAVRVVLALASR